MRRRDKSKNTMLVLMGVIFIVLGLVCYLLGVLMGPLRLLADNPGWWKALNEAAVWYSGVPIVIGITMVVVGLATTVNRKRKSKKLVFEPVTNQKLVVALTAYNDEESIFGAVEDFLSHPLVEKVIVVSNNSTDKTIEEAGRAGAVVFNETVQGYGACVHRCLTEASQIEGYELVVLCEGDATFRAYDIDKLMAYTPHADIVVGTRIVEQLQESDTQLSMFMHYGNFFVGKLLEMKHLGDVTLSDVGTTYKICRSEILREVLPRLDKRVNLEFNPYFLDTLVGSGYKVVECPISFHPRIGESKGGNIDNSVALKLGLRMIRGIIFGWRANVD